MKIVFAGTPDFAATALAALYQAGHQISLVLSQPDRPAGRGMSLQASPVKRLALEHGTEVFQPLNLKDEEAQARLRREAPDVMVVAAYGLLLPQAVLDIPRLGCLNIHASLLPRWRGAAPIHRAILAGDRESGVCIMAMEAGLDTGPVLLRRAEPILETDTTALLHDRLAVLGGELIVEALAGLEAGKLVAQPQEEAGAVYAAKLSKGEAPLDWRQSAEVLSRQVRAFNPFPGATANLGGNVLKIWNGVAEAGEGNPGQVLEVTRQGIRVACGQGTLVIRELQKAGGKRLPVAQFLAGHPVQVGQQFSVSVA
ncbi:methionyl-tRNA formyltransferase [Azospira inquinata]|uniref:Methionyl-tRNA formyltransferase n=1 Tax=Azospira inquinata TaxID=2785627 RepID=A0A975XVY1_9RHOO|nr:methionyl-tRNA formyltransferase [Azospira inquinata]QWT47043.1 methionyl-tRNA formyltransferase [Azospira inquinata]QWT50327.1 methionyl-tRNA formyltransferase [Azospira inquinata]